MDAVYARCSSNKHGHSRDTHHLGSASDFWVIAIFTSPKLCKIDFISQKRLMAKAPGMAILWIYAIIQLDLGYALVTLGACALYYHREYLLKTILDPSSEFMKLKL
jgi:hypothetical protein